MWKNVAMALVLAFGSAAVLSGCEEEGPMEEAGENIDETMEHAGEKMEEAGEHMEEKAEDATN